MLYQVLLQQETYIASHITINRIELNVLDHFAGNEYSTTGKEIERCFPKANTSIDGLQQCVWKKQLTLLVKKDNHL